MAREAVVTLAPATVPCSPTLHKRQDLSWFRNRPKSPTCGAIAAQTKYLAQNLPPACQPPGTRVGLTSGRGQLAEPPTTPRLARRATEGVSRIFSSLKRKDRQGCLSNGSCLDQLTTQLPLSSADAHLRRRAYSYSDHDTICQTLMAGSENPWPRISGEEKRAVSVSKAAARLLTIFPDMAGKVLGDFACTLDHAGMRWYGRIFVGRSCLCFTGTGITLSGSMSTGRRSPPPVYRWSSEEPASFRSLSSASNTLIKSPRQWPVSSTSLVAANRPELSKTCKPWRKTALKIAFHDITRVSKELTMGLWPNAMTLATGHRQYIFTNFLRRDRAHQCLSEAWQLHCQQRRMAEKYSVVERLPIVAARKSLSKHTLPLGNVPPLLPATYSACESEATICEHTSFVARQCSTNSNRNTWLNDMPIAKHDDDVNIFALILLTFGCNHALFLVLFAMCCLMSLTAHS
ncbi:hypothetical protein H4R27_001259 [Coemansia aciculifera]|nr:hypothetical protein H4R27_001259 [Coemansia aciculifera]